MLHTNTTGWSITKVVDKDGEEIGATVPDSRQNARRNTSETVKTALSRPYCSWVCILLMSCSLSWPRVKGNGRPLPATCRGRRGVTGYLATSYLSDGGVYLLFSPSLFYLGRIQKGAMPPISFSPKNINISHHLGQRSMRNSKCILSSCWSVCENDFPDGERLGWSTCVPWPT